MDEAPPPISAELLRAVFAAHEQERAEYATRLHEDVGQALKALVLGLQRAPGGDPVEHQRLRRLAGQSLEAVRGMALELRPATLDELGLAAAVRGVARAAEGAGRLRVSVLVDVPERRPGPAGAAPEVELALYRVVQEALDNVVRHACASAASVIIGSGADGWWLVVEDDGVGFEPDALPASRRLGLTRSAGRLLALRGSLRVESAPGGGTSVYGRVPAG